MQNNVARLLPDGHVTPSQSQIPQSSARQPGSKKKWTEKLVTAALFGDKVAEAQRKLDPTGGKDIRFFAPALADVWENGLLPTEEKEVKAAVVEWNKGPISEQVQRK